MVKVLFFPCYCCGTWRYSLKKSGKVKCLKCGKMIDLEKTATQEYKLMSMYEAPKIMQNIKETNSKKRKLND